ncbi:MAG: hypothetical protein RL065_352 [Bacteroidota bacterium]
MQKERLLTKSRFKLGISCEAKLFYTGKKEYANLNDYDEFLKMLAEGGYQVGELAKDYYHIKPEHEITDKDYFNSVAKTTQLLTENENISIAEAAIRFENLFIRADLLIKNGNQLHLIEVKAKSIAVDKFDDNPFIGKKGNLNTQWAPYLYDVAFQKYVLQKAFPKYQIKSSLLLVDKNATTCTDGLHQVYKIVKTNGGRFEIRKTRNLTNDELQPQNKILIEINVDDIVSMIHKSDDGYMDDGLGFEERIKLYASQYEADRFPTENNLKPECSKCEFRNSEKTAAAGLKSGFENCFVKAGYSDQLLSQPMTFELWGGGNTKVKGELIKAGKLFFNTIKQTDIARQENFDLIEDCGLTQAQRKWIQIEGALSKKTEEFIMLKGLAQEMNTWKYPLNMIDFETTRVAIPFFAGSSPYQQIAFQFSHHIIDKNGIVQHSTQWLNDQVGEFPNYEFVRALRNALQKNDGTIFRYSTHENSVLNEIKAQLELSTEADKKELIDFIELITYYKVSGDVKIEGVRNMIDLWDVVKRFYWHPDMKGSNSIKAVLPAMMNCSDFLIQKYSKPIYGTEDFVSLNFTDKTWLKLDTNLRIIDPYKSLESISENIDVNEFDYFISNDNEEDTINNGGLAMMIYAQLQFSDIEASKKSGIRRSLLKYCELDTLAMVMIYEHFKSKVDNYYT